MYDVLLLEEGGVSVVGVVVGMVVGVEVVFIVVVPMAVFEGLVVGTMLIVVVAFTWVVEVMRVVESELDGELREGVVVPELPTPPGPP